MDTQIIDIGNNKVSVVTAKDILISEVGDANDIMANSPTDHMVLNEHNFERDFFDLSTRKLGEVLQKFTNYRVKLAIIGDFSKYPGESLKAFIYESNKHGDYLFVTSMDEIRKYWKK